MEDYSTVQAIGYGIIGVFILVMGYKFYKSKKSGGGSGGSGSGDRPSDRDGLGK